MPENKRPSFGDLFIKREQEMAKITVPGGVLVGAGAGFVFGVKMTIEDEAVSIPIIAVTGTIVGAVGGALACEPPNTGKKWSKEIEKDCVIKAAEGAAIGGVGATAAGFVARPVATIGTTTVVGTVAGALGGKLLSIGGGGLIAAVEYTAEHGLVAMGEEAVMVAERTGTRLKADTQAAYESVTGGHALIEALKYAGAGIQSARNGTVLEDLNTAADDMIVSMGGAPVLSAKASGAQR